MTATSYPLFDAVLTMLWFAGLFLWVWLAISVFIDLFKSDMAWWGKTLWVVAILVLPLVGVLAYFIVRGRKMAERAAAESEARDAAARDYIRSVGNGKGPSTADELAKLASLRDAGIMSDEEFRLEKAQLLAHVN